MDSYSFSSAAASSGSSLVAALSNVGLVELWVAELARTSFVVLRWRGALGLGVGADAVDAEDLVRAGKVARSERGMPWGILYRYYLWF